MVFLLVFGQSTSSKKRGAIAMYATVTKPLTFKEFLAWDDRSGRDFKLLDGLPVPLSEPNANHEDLIERLCTYLENHSQ